MIDIGNIEIQDLFVGSANAVGLYQGDVEVWSKDTPPNPLTVVKYKAASGLDDWEDDIVGDLHGGVDMWHRPQPTAQIPNVLSADSVEIGTHVTSVGQVAFINCTNISEVTIPDSVLSIGLSAFVGCRGLTSITMGDGVTSIGNYAFLSCTNLSEITIPDSVTSLGTATFRGCSGLTNVTIGNGLTSIGSSAFDGCSGLTSVHITDIAKWCGISFGSLDANPLYYAHNLYCNGVKVTDLVVPDSVTSIGNGAFYFCSGLTSVTIGDSVTSIGKNAFTNCTNLTSVTFVGKDMATVQGMSDYKWGLKTGCVLHCTDGDITI